MVIAFDERSTITLNDMKNTLLIMLFGLGFNVYSQDVNETIGTVEKVLDIPVFIYSFPQENFEEVTRLTARWSVISSVDNRENTNVNRKIKEILKKAKP